MRKKAPAPPPAPDFTRAAEQTAQGNLQMARYQTEANRINQTTPWGSLTYDKVTTPARTRTGTADNGATFNEQAYLSANPDVAAAIARGAFGGKAINHFNEYGRGEGREGFWNDIVDAPESDNWTQTVTLDPRLQAALDSQIRLQSGMSQTAEGMLGRVNDSFATPFNPASLGSFMENVGTVDQSTPGRVWNRFETGARINTNVPNAAENRLLLGPVAFNGDGVQALDQRRTDPTQFFANVRDVDQDILPFLQAAGVQRVNQAAPTFDPSRQAEFSKAAFEAKMALQRDDLKQNEERLRNSLALQGLVPGTEAYNNAMLSFENSRAAALNQLSNQAVLTGNEMANRDFASQLAGFRAGNDAQGQAFDQAVGAMTSNNNARMQALQQGNTRFGAELTATEAANRARDQAFAQAMQRAQFALAAQQAANAARAQQQGLDLQGFETGNRAQIQMAGLDRDAWNAEAERLSTNAQLQESQNRAQQQAFAQALQLYGTNFQDEFTRRNMPLNELNSLLAGNEVTMPQFNPVPQQTFVPGADTLGAVGAQYGADMGRWNTQVQSRNASNALFGNLLGTGAMAAATFFSDKRLKKNIEKIGETEGGTNVYQWDWKESAKPMVGDKPTVGVIAQENPRASIKGPGGFLMVDYSKIQ